MPSKWNLWASATLFFPWLRMQIFWLMLRSATSRMLKICIYAVKHWSILTPYFLKEKANYRRPSLSTSYPSMAQFSITVFRAWGLRTDAMVSTELSWMLVSVSFWELFYLCKYSRKDFGSARLEMEASRGCHSPWQWKISQGKWREQDNSRN